MRTWILVALIALSLAPSRALTVNEIIELSRAGVGDATIIAQMRADGSRFRLDARTLLKLQDEGVSETLMQAMIATATPVATPAPTARPSIAERRRQPLVVTQVIPSWGWPPPCQTVTPPVSYTIGPNPPMFVNGSPGTYMAPPAYQVPVGCYRPAATYSGQTGVVVIRVGDR